MEFGTAIRVRHKMESVFLGHAIRSLYGSGYDIAAR